MIWRFAFGLAVLVALFLLASGMDRLPGAAGAAIQRNVAHDRGAGIFYTDLDDWLALVRRVQRRVRNEALP